MCVGARLRNKCVVLFTFKNITGVILHFKLLFFINFLHFNDFFCACKKGITSITI